MARLGGRSCNVTDVTVTEVLCITSVALLPIVRVRDLAHKHSDSDKYSQCAQC